MNDILRKCMGKLVILAVVLSMAFWPPCPYGNNTAYAQTSDDWLIYWYLCGSDLESELGAATDDISELMEVQLPANVQVLIMTGGSEQWHNDTVKPGEIGLYLYNDRGMHELARLEDADMGSAQTLEYFLQFGKENYSASHNAFVFWNHGGGSAAGVCVDERTGNALSLNDINQSFSAVYGSSVERPPFEMVGFDACLMASYDTANALYGLSRYMTASEEIEPGNGWLYNVWVGALAQDTSMDGRVMGKVICDSYMAGCRKEDTDKDATMSVIDLSKLPALKQAYEDYGVESLRYAADNPRGFFSVFGRQAQVAENYGGNTRDQGYSNMVDLGDLATQTTRLLPETSGNLVRAVNNAVVYKVQGEYRNKGKGISGFYSYDGDPEMFARYVEQESAPLAQKCLYYYLIYGELPLEAQEFLAGDGIVGGNSLPDAVSAVRTDIFRVEQLEDMVVDVDADGYYYVNLTPEQMELLSSIRCQLMYVGVEDDVMLYLGSDSDVVADWDKGVFKDNFRGVWPMLDGHPIYVEITAEENDYNLYSVPIKLNGEECNLQVAYNFNDSNFHIMGARKGIDKRGMGSRNLVKLKAGDQITTIHYAVSISNPENDLMAVEADTFTVGDNPVVTEQELGDGIYGYCFEFVSPTDESAYSSIVQFTMKDGEIVASNE